MWIEYPKGGSTGSTAPGREFPAGAFFMPDDFSGTAGSIRTGTVGLMECSRITIGSTAPTFLSMSTVVSTAVSGANAEYGVYADSNGKPGALLVNFGNISTATSGARTLAINWTPTANTAYWLAVLFLTAASTFTSKNIGGNTLMGTSVTNINSNIPAAWQQTGLGALPNPFAGAITALGGNNFIYVAMGT
jgi:hypothetical protein